MASKKKDQLISDELGKKTAEILRTLTPREEAVLRARFGIGESDATKKKKLLTRF